MNYFCTDKLGIYKLKRFTSVKENKYFIANYYRRIDKRIEIIKREREKKKEKSNNDNNNNIIKFRKIDDSNKEINIKNITKEEIKEKEQKEIKKEKEIIENLIYNSKNINNYLINTSNGTTINHNIVINDDNNNNEQINELFNPKAKTIQGKLRVKKKILERNEYKVEEGFAVHIANKSETCAIEGLNSIIRNYLARFNRRTKRISKSKDMIEWSLWLLFDKLYWGYVVK